MQVQGGRGKHGPDQKLEFPNTACYLPTIYSLLGVTVEKLSDAEALMEHCRQLLSPHIKGKIHAPYLGQTPDGGITAIFAEEIVEAILYVAQLDFYSSKEEILPLLQDRKHPAPETDPIT